MVIYLGFMAYCRWVVEQHVTREWIKGSELFMRWSMWEFDCVCSAMSDDGEEEVEEEQGPNLGVSCDKTIWTQQYDWVSLHMSQTFTE